MTVVMVEQLNRYLIANCLLPQFQSTYSCFHSTETALLHLMSDILKAADQQQVTLLGMLDLSAAFDCVDRAILLNRLQRGMGLDGVVLSWLWSFLTDHSQHVAYAGELSVLVELLFSVPQGSVLGPLLFLLYMADLYEVMLARAHFYANDGQLYISTPALRAEDTIRQFTDCLCEVEA